MSAYLVPPAGRFDGSGRGLSATDETERLRARWGAAELHLLGSVASTNDVARALAENGAPGGTVVIADEQTAGRGRAGRGWNSAAGQGLWVSLVVQAPGRDSLPLLPLIAAVELARCLEGLPGMPTVGVKWPNDLEVDGRKLAGILCEAVWSGDAPTYAVVGAGVNVLQRRADFPADLRSRATSVRESGAAVSSVREVADRVIPELIAALAEAPPPEEVVRRLAGRDVLNGREVVVSDPLTLRVTHRGTAHGVNLSGALILRDAAGRTQYVHTGTVTFNLSESE